jgi:hypothetical protein
LVELFVRGKASWRKAREEDEAEAKLEKGAPRGERGGGGEIRENR